MVFLGPPPGRAVVCEGGLVRYQPYRLEPFVPVRLRNARKNTQHRLMQRVGSNPARRQKKSKRFRRAEVFALPIRAIGIHQSLLTSHTLQSWVPEPGGSGYTRLPPGTQSEQDRQTVIAKLFANLAFEVSTVVVSEGFRVVYEKQKGWRANSI
jgi:hypothetical protein